MTEDSELELLKKLDELRVTHRHLDEKIYALSNSNPENEFQMAMLKKQKLSVRDQISSIEGILYPDIIA